MAFKDGVILGPVSLNATGNATTTINGVVDIGVDNSTNAITIGTGTGGRQIDIGFSAANHGIRIGVNNGTTSVDLLAGSGGINISAIGGTASLNGSTGVGIDAAAGAIDIGTGANAQPVNIATGAAVRNLTMGSTNSTSATTVQSGSGALNVTSTNGALTVNSGTGALGISTDASATTVSIATGGAVKTTTVGSTNSTSTTTIACGTGGANFGTSANAHATVVGSTTALSTTTIQAPSAGVILTGVAGVTVSNKNYVTINTSTGAIGSTTSSMTWNEVTGTSDTMVVDNGYIANNGGLVTLTLPTTVAVGSIIRVTGKGAGGWRIAQSANQQINFGLLSTSVGAGGRLDSTATYDTVELVCITANNIFNVISSIGNITVT